MTEGKVADIEFGDPPEKRGAPYDWEAIAKQLRRRGKSKKPWARVFTQDRTTYVTAIRAGHVAALHPAKGFVVRTENNVYGSPRLCDLWLRYDPEKDEEKKR